MKHYRLNGPMAVCSEPPMYRIWKHIGPLMDREVYCIYKDTCERTARAVLRDLEKQK